LNANLTYTNKALSVSADALQNNSGTVASLEGTYQINKNLSVSARLQSTGKEAVAIKDQIGKNHFVQLQQEIIKPQFLSVGTHNTNCSHRQPVSCHEPLALPFFAQKQPLFTICHNNYGAPGKFIAMVKSLAFGGQKRPREGSATTLPLTGIFVCF